MEAGISLTRLVSRNYFFVKRLHSFLGIVPLAIFLLEHFMVNSLSRLAPAVFNSAVGVLRSIPYLIPIELGLIIIPLYIHGFLGLWIVMQGDVDVRQNYLRNWLYVLQRITGLIVIIFVTYHIIATRLWSEYVLETSNLYGLMSNYLKNPFIFGFYVLGVVCASYHVGNGLFNFLYKWGITVSEKSQTFAMVVCLLIASVFAGMGIYALIGFVIQ